MIRTHIYFQDFQSSQGTVLLSSMYNDKKVIEHKIGELYCFGLDNYENGPSKKIVLIDQQTNVLYQGQVIIPNNENELLSLKPHLNLKQIDRIFKSPELVVKGAVVSSPIHPIAVSTQKKCPAKKEINPFTNRCVNLCKDGYARNEKFQCRTMKFLGKKGNTVHKKKTMKKKKKPTK